MTRDRLSVLRQSTFSQIVRKVGLRTAPTAALLKLYYRAKFWEPMWRHVVNRRAVILHAQKPIPLSELQLKLARELTVTGIVGFHLDDLLGEGTSHSLMAEAATLFAKREIRAEIEAGKGTVGGKEFVVRVFKREPKLDLSTVLGSMCIDERILAIVNVYLGMYARLKSFDLWHNVPIADPNAPETASQHWHRDYDDHRLVKLFVYLTDVDESMGPFTYMRETHPGARFSKVFPSTPPMGSYPRAADVEHAIPHDRFAQYVGGAGTAILCDTTGFHKGGRSTSRPRELFVATYASRAALDADAYTVITRNGRALTTFEAYAIGTKE